MYLTCSYKMVIFSNGKSVFKQKFNKKNVWLKQDSNLGPLGEGIYSSKNQKKSRFFSGLKKAKWVPMGRVGVKYKS